MHLRARMRMKEPPLSCNRQQYGSYCMWITNGDANAKLLISIEKCCICSDKTICGDDFILDSLWTDFELAGNRRAWLHNGWSLTNEQHTKSVQQTKTSPRKPITLAWKRCNSTSLLLFVFLHTIFFTLKWHETILSEKWMMVIESFANKYLLWPIKWLYKMPLPMSG